MGSTNLNQRMMCGVVDELAEHQPEQLFCMQSISSGVSQGWQNVPIHDLASAVNYTSWWIEMTIGKSSTPEPLAYIGANDIRYVAIYLACMKTGYVALLPSPRNSVVTSRHVLTATKCSKLFYSAGRDKIAHEITNNAEGVYGRYKSYGKYSVTELHRLPKPVYLTNGSSASLTTSLTCQFRKEEAIFHSTPVIMCPEIPMTPALLTQILETTHPDVATLTPSVMQELCASGEGLNGLKQFQRIFFAGAPFSPDVGNKLIQNVPLHSIIGSSEAGFIGALVPLHSEDWEYFEWNPYSGIHMESIGDGVYEAVIRGGENRDFLGISHIYPDITEYRTKDLFTPHPTRLGLWRYHGRFNDVIVFSNGEKFNPIDMGTIVEGHHLVSKAVIIGQRRFQSSLLVRPNWQEWSEDQDMALFLDQIWPTVQRANSIAPGHARVLPTKVTLAKKNKPFELTPKGSVQRRQVAKVYESEIDALYATENGEYTGMLPQSTNFDDIKEYIRKKLYDYPTIGQLAEFIYRLIRGKVNTGYAVDEETSRAGKIAALINKYTEDLPPRYPSELNRSTKHAIIMTGSTGSLGSYILSELVSDREFPKIYCLNRAEDAKQKQIQSFERKGLLISPDFDRLVEFLHSRFGALNFGLSIDKYNELKASVDLIIHNEWKVNFNHRAEALEATHIRGIRSLVDFSLQSTHSAHIHFISSISTVSAWGPQHGPSVPEVPLEDPDVVLRQGYGESKFIGERTCAVASSVSGVPTSIYRVGQVGGPTMEKDLWNRHEWLPSLVATSKTLKEIPRTLGTMPVDWAPVDIVAKAVVQITESRRVTEGSTRAAAFHIVNPHTANWEALIPTIQKYYDAGIVDIHDWIAALVSIANPTDVDLQDKPALKILDFYRGLLGEHGSFTGVMEKSKTQAASKAMRDLGPIDEAIIENWIKQWRF
ncbi:hypothetical protein BBP40_000784 [Aspergillus hancockii]|nr:hypothetical protein BBP40_000784 [Aspergillus hancockii]